MTRGGLDRYLPPEAVDYSNLPEFIEDHAGETDAPAVDCAGTDAGSPICQLAKAEQEIEAAKPVAPETAKAP
jgi:hypothetical protein